ncbi:TonB-dependent receptor [Phenylobacterium sp.]|uniref:TonB-dependent receptor plug domain-containing protein n=1 Tax=Phenylobacterium sp. TaxID=1871053 RepID=UPI0025DEFA8D|nr:TonB-dependent receptor [Phenylobacterium sp.]
MTGWRRRWLLGAAVATLGGAAQVGAARAAEAEVDEVVVSGRLEETLPQTLSQFGSRLEVVSGEEVRRGLFVDAGSVLATSLPGLSLIPQAGPFSYNNASLQGSRSSEILYLVDGVRISNRLYNSTPPLDTIPAHMIERVEQLEGGQGLFFGTQGVAGVVNIVTRDFTDDLSGRLQIGGNTNDAVSASGYVTGSAGRQHFLAFASHDEAKGYQVFRDSEYEPSGTDRHRGYRMTSVGGKYALDLSDAVRFTASYAHNQGRAELPRPNLVSEALNNRNEEIAYAKLDIDFSERLSLFVKGYWHDWDSSYSETDTRPGGGRVVVSDKEIWRFDDRGVNALARYVLQPGLELWGGYDLQRYGGRDDVLIIAPRKETAQAVFAQVRVTPEMLPNTHLAAGFRSNFTKHSENATVWTVSGQYDLTPNLFVRGAAGTAFRLPDAESLFAQDSLNNGEIGNPDLKPERSRNLNLSIGGQTEAFRVEAIAFFRDTKDLISLDGATPDPDVLQFINLPDKVKARGFELSASGQATDWVSWKAAYTHARTKQTGSALQLVNVPEDFGMASVDISPPGKPYGAGARLNWVGDVYDNLPSGIGRVNRGNYAVVDLTAYVDVGPGRLSAKLENALGEDYAVLTRRYFRDTGPAYIGHFRGAPRTLHVSYAYSF